jgi:hypothetical protein
MIEQAGFIGTNDTGRDDAGKPIGHDTVKEPETVSGRCQAISIVASIAEVCLTWSSPGSQQQGKAIRLLPSMEFTLPRCFRMYGRDEKGTPGSEFHHCQRPSLHNIWTHRNNIPSHLPDLPYDLPWQPIVL